MTMRGWILERLFPEVGRDQKKQTDLVIQLQHTRQMLCQDVQDLRERLKAAEDALCEDAATIRKQRSMLAERAVALKRLEERQEHKAMPGGNRCSVCKYEIANGQIYVMMRTFRHQRCEPQPPRFDACGRLLS